LVFVNMLVQSSRPGRRRTDKKALSEYLLSLSGRIYGHHRQLALHNRERLAHG
jgi:hypothetical protein